MAPSTVVLEIILDLAAQLVLALARAEGAEETLAELQRQLDGLKQALDCVVPSVVAQRKELERRVEEAERLADRYAGVILGEAWSERRVTSEPFDS